MLLASEVKRIQQTVLKKALTSLPVQFNFTCKTDRVGDGVRTKKVVGIFAWLLKSTFGQTLTDNVGVCALQKFVVSRPEKPF